MDLVQVTFFDGALHVIFTGIVESGQTEPLSAFGSQRPLNCLVTAWPNDDDPLHDEAPFFAMRFLVDDQTRSMTKDVSIHREWQSGKTQPA